jgi:hypothetical protein
MIPDDIREHIQAMDRWLEQLGRVPKQLSGLSDEERKQLQAIDKAIQQLRRNGVPVPEDLRGMKLKLSARDDTRSEIYDIETRLKDVEDFIQEIGRPFKTARAIRDRLKSTGQAGGTKKHYNVDLKDLIRAELLSVENHLELQWLKNGPVLKGKVLPDGAVMVNTPNGWQRYETLSTAASRVAQRSLNGWKHWRRVNSDGTTITLEDIRARFIRDEADQ